MAEDRPEIPPSKLRRFIRGVGGVAGAINRAVVDGSGIEAEDIERVPLKKINESIVASRIAIHLKNTVRERLGAGSKWDNGFNRMDAFRVLGYYGPTFAEDEYNPLEKFPEEYLALGSVLQRLVDNRVLRFGPSSDGKVRYWVENPAQLNELARQVHKTK